MYKSRKVGEDMDIGGVVAPVILAIMVGLNFIRMAPRGCDVFHHLAHAVFVISKISYSTEPTVFLPFSVAFHFG